MYRDHTKEIQIGDKKIGGGNPVLIQSMCNTKTENVAATIEQIHRLEDAGCDIIRVAVPTMEAAAAIREIKKRIHRQRPSTAPFFPNRLTLRFRLSLDRGSHPASGFFWMIFYTRKRRITA